jgi:UDP-N-acetylmuramate dehydrogenase
LSHADDQTPDPKVNGNAGSFFKNPVISGENAKAFLAGWPTAPYPQADGSVKLAAGWLIDQCQLKGATMGGCRCIASRHWF